MNESTHVLHATVAVEGDPADVVLAEPRPDFQTIQVGSALTLLCDTASPALCLAIAAAFTDLADQKSQQQIVALNTPSVPQVPTWLHPVGPDYGAAS